MVNCNLCLYPECVLDLCHLVGMAHQITDLCFARLRLDSGSIIHVLGGLALSAKNDNSPPFALEPNPDGLGGMLIEWVFSPVFSVT